MKLLLGFEPGPENPWMQGEDRDTPSEEHTIIINRGPDRFGIFLFIKMKIWFKKHYDFFNWLKKPGGVVS